MEMADLKRDMKLLGQKNAKVFVFLQSPSENLASLVNKEDWPFEMICDPKGKIFQQYAVEPGGLLKYLHPAGLIAAIKATVRGFVHGKFEGRETQLPAAFIVNPDQIITYAYYGKTINDVPKAQTLAENIEQQ